MRLNELHQVDEDVGEWITKAICALAVATSMGTVGLGLGLGKGPLPPDLPERVQRLLHNASLRQISRIREALKKKSLEDLKRELEALRGQKHAADDGAAE